jgi:phage-related protein
MAAGLLHSSLKTDEEFKYCGTVPCYRRRSDPDDPVRFFRLLVYNYLYTEPVAPMLKPIAWMGDSRDRVRFFSKAARRAVGPALQSVQEGLDPEDWRPMPRVGAGVKEIRVHAENEYRVLYVAKFETAVYVLHAFVKKRRETPEEAINLARLRYREAVRIERLRSS